MTTDLFEIPETPLSLEKRFWKQELHLIAGVDEVGRGALAGPVVAAAVIMDERAEMLIGKIKDSKLIREETREELFPQICNLAVAYGFGVIEPIEIDSINILRASLKAMAIAIESLELQPDLCLIDGNQKTPTAHRQQTIVQGDRRVFSIGAASILAKVKRDRIMRSLASDYPHYQWAKNKGYGTRIHLDAIRSFGPCALHRKSFSMPTR